MTTPINHGSRDLCLTCGAVMLEPHLHGGSCRRCRVVAHWSSPEVHAYLMAWRAALTATDANLDAAWAELDRLYAICQQLPGAEI